MVAILIGTPLIYMLSTLLSKKVKGTWDEQSRITGRMRAEGWKVKETTENLVSFVLNRREAPEFWPIAKKAAGVECVSSPRSVPAWRSSVFVAPSVGTHLFFAMDLPQRSDGTEAEFAEALVRVNDGALTYEGAGEVPEFLDDAVRRFLIEWNGLQAAHFWNDTITFMFDGRAEDPIEALKAIADQAPKIIPLISDSAWV